MLKRLIDRPRASRRAAWLCLAALAACASTGEDDAYQPREAEPAAPLAGPAPRAASPEELELVRLEEQRSTGDGRLIELLVDGQSALRARAALALGRIPLERAGREVTEALCEALADPEPAVASHAAFALGLRADPASAAVLGSYFSTPHPQVRAEVVCAASKLPDQPSLRAGVLQALRDAEVEVVLQALVGTTRWDSDAPDAERVDTELLAVLHPFLRPIAGTPLPEASVAWTALFALQRRVAEKGRGAFHEFLDSDIALARVYAVRGLSRLEAHGATRGALEAALADADERVAYEAAFGLRTHGSAGSVAALLAHAQHASAHVRAEVWGALEACASAADGVALAEARQLASADPSALVRANALRCEASLLDDAAAVELLGGAILDASWVVRRAAAEALGGYPGAAPDDLLPGPLDLFARDEDPAVAGAALTALGAQRGARAHELLVLHLSHSDYALRAAALEALGAEDEAGARLAQPEDAPAIVDCLRSSHGDISQEIATIALRLLAELGGEDARAALRAAHSHPDPFVRAVAREAFAEAFPDEAAPEVSEPAPELVAVESVGALGSRHPQLVLETSRGALRFELFPDETPLHVHNVLELAEQGHYDGLRFHRVVPDFVIQGGDYRGDGYGQQTWRGGSLPHEFSPRRYVRGSLGMPRGEDPDSGGSQLFVTHRPTPHLDGRYTILGELREGFDVLDAIEVGDRILSARVAR